MRLAHEIRHSCLREEKVMMLDTTEQDKRSTARGGRETKKKRMKEKWIYMCASK
jgi:hypothetical protein